jgi:serine/threonine protein kinase
VHKETGEKYAIKFIHKSFVSPKELKFLEREMDIMRKLEHKNIIQLIEVGESLEDIYIVMEL